jgi:hypothetical protein
VYDRKTSLRHSAGIMGRVCVRPVADADANSSQRGKCRTPPREAAAHGCISQSGHDTRPILDAHWGAVVIIDPSRPQYRRGSMRQCPANEARDLSGIGLVRGQIADTLLRLNRPRLQRVGSYKEPLTSDYRCFCMHGFILSTDTKKVPYSVHVKQTFVLPRLCDHLACPLGYRRNDDGVVDPTPRRFSDRRFPIFWSRDRTSRCPLGSSAGVF